MHMISWLRYWLCNYAFHRDGVCFLVRCIIFLVSFASHCNSPWILILISIRHTAEGVQKRAQNLQSFVERWRKRRNQEDQKGKGIVGHSFVSRVILEPILWFECFQFHITDVKYSISLNKRLLSIEAGQKSYQWNSRALNNGRGLQRRALNCSRPRFDAG